MTSPKDRQSSSIENIMRHSCCIVDDDVNVELAVNSCKKLNDDGDLKLHNSHT